MLLHTRKSPTQNIPFKHFIYKSTEIEYSIADLMLQYSNEPLNISEKDKHKYCKKYKRNSFYKPTQQSLSHRQKSQDNNRYRKEEL